MNSFYYSKNGEVLGKKQPLRRQRLSTKLFIFIFVYPNTQSKGSYPPGNWHIPPGGKENHLQKCLGRGYVSSLEGMFSDFFGRNSRLLFVCFFSKTGRKQKTPLPDQDNVHDDLHLSGGHFYTPPIQGPLKNIGHILYYHPVINWDLNSLNLLLNENDMKGTSKMMESWILPKTSSSPLKKLQYRNPKGKDRLPVLSISDRRALTFREGILPPRIKKRKSGRISNSTYLSNILPFSIEPWL